MTAATPTFSQIKAQVAAIRQKFPHARVIGIRAQGRWTGEKVRQDGEQVYAIHQCDSPLAMRLALRDETNGDATKILITGLDDTDLSDDIRIRLTRRKLFPIDSWQIIRSFFQAHAVDPRLTRQGWIADALLNVTSPDLCTPAPGGFLDAEIVWPILLGRIIGLSAERPDLQALLRWSADAENAVKFRAATPEFRDAAIEWLSGLAGPAAAAVLKCVVLNDRPDALPVGLAAGVVFHPDAAGRLERSAGKLEERFLGGISPDPETIQRWSAAATEVIRKDFSDEKLKRPQLQRADEILVEVQAESYAWVSDTSPLGFEQRLARFGRQLLETIRDRQWSVLEPLTGARDAIRRHDRAADECRPLERSDMAVRLVRWLDQASQGPPRESRSFAEAANSYLADGGFVDWARLRLRSIEPVAELSEANTRLFDEVTQIREEQSRRFATLLRDWTAVGSAGDEVVPVERLLERIIAPLAEAAPVLLILIDGMSVAVCRELLADVTKREWVLLAEEGRGTMRSGLAAIPSVTEASRTSLFCGTLRQGTAADEKTGFAQHAALLAHCRSGSPPILFHKLSLQESEDAMAAPEVRREIASSHRRVVGVVINAVDDHLLKGEQIDTRWTRDEIRVLPTLLHEARSAHRIVVLLADHGHVLDCRTDCRPHDGGERWRPDDGSIESEELAIAGSRVVLPESKRLIAPWSEKIRYGMKKNGYHGGLTPQEMIVPIAVLCTPGEYPAGWTEARIETPDWWDDPTPAVQATDFELPLKPVKPKPSGRLFDLDDEQTPPRPQVGERPVTATAVTAQPEWISRLIASDVFAEQKKLGGRAVPPNEVFAKILISLDSRGNKMTSAALSRGLEYPPLRLRGLLAVVQRVLNVDGYGVLTRDEASDTVELNRDLLLRQFDLT